MIDLFGFFSLSKKQKMTNELLASNDYSCVKTMQSSRDYVSWAQHLEVTNALKKLKNSQLENLDDAYVCNL